MFLIMRQPEVLVHLEPNVCRNCSEMSPPSAAGRPVHENLRAGCLDRGQPSNQAELTKQCGHAFRWVKWPRRPQPLHRSAFVTRHHLDPAYVDRPVEALGGCRLHVHSVTAGCDRNAFYAKGGGWGLSPPTFSW